MNQAQVLIVDDDRDLATSLADFVKMNGHGVRVASNGLEAAERFRQHEYDITFMDVDMPVMNGVEGFMEIRKLRPNARIVMMTGFWRPIVERALASGALGLLQKPFRFSELLAWIDGLSNQSA